MAWYGSDRAEVLETKKMLDETSVTGWNIPRDRLRILRFHVSSQPDRANTRISYHRVPASWRVAPVTGVPMAPPGRCCPLLTGPNSP